MKHRSRWIGIALLLGCLPLAACSQSDGTAAADESHPATVEHLDGAEPTRVTLTEEAAKRLDLHTETVREVVLKGAMRTVIPYAAVLYDTDGNTWAYTSPEPLVFVRHRIEVDYIDGEIAVLTEGLPAGTPVVTMGAQELYGSELEFEEE